MPRTADPLERRRKELLGIATELFAHKGVHGASMGELAEAAQINKGTLYHYFESKAIIVYEIFRSVADDVQKGIQGIAPTTPPSQMLREVMRVQLEIIAHRPEAVRVYYRESSMLATWMPAALVSDIRAREAIYSDFIVAVLRRGIKEGVFRRVDVKVTAFALIGVGAWATTWYDPGGAIKVDQLAVQYSELVLRGLEVPSVAQSAPLSRTRTSRRG